MKSSKRKREREESLDKDGWRNLREEEEFKFSVLCTWKKRKSVGSLEQKQDEMKCKVGGKMGRQGGRTPHTSHTHTRRKSSFVLRCRI